VSDTPRKQGGGEPTPADHDRPEQNEGYDEAVRRGGRYEDAWHHLRDEDRPASPDVDDRQAEDAAAEVRRRERSG